MSEVQKGKDVLDTAQAQPAESPFSAEAQLLLGMNGSTDVAEKPATGPAVQPGQKDDPYLRTQPPSPRPDWQRPGAVTTPPFAERWIQTHPGIFAPPAAPEVCAQSKTYDQLIEKSVRNLYDPSPLSRIPDLKTKYNCLIKNDADAFKYANEALKATGDPFNSVIAPIEARAIAKGRLGTQGDLGATVKKVNDAHVVEQVTPANGADAGGLKKGDVITHVNGENVSRFSDKELQQRITALDATTVGVKVIRDGKELDLTVKRTEKQLSTVKDIMLPDNVLYLRLDAMDADYQPDQLKAAIEKHPNAQSYIIDLRDNPGGQLFSALKMASLFVDKGNLLTVSKRMDSDPEKPVFSSRHYLLTPDGISVTSSLDPAVKPDSQMARFKKITDKPVAVLVNGRTASAAEILAVSLQENGAATLVGEKTFGKGIGQTIYSDMPAGSALKLTTFRFLSPKGNWLGDGINDRRGIAADIIGVKTPSTAFGTDADEQLKAAREHLKNKKSR